MPTPDLRLSAETLWISPYVFSSFVALREKGVPFEIQEISLGDGGHLQAAYREASMTARVPTLEHAGFHLSESSAIAEYLDEVLPPPAHQRLFPDAIRDRARARQLMAWIRSDLDALRAERSSVTMFYRFRLPPLSDACRRATDKLFAVAEQVVPPGEGPLFGAWSLIDSELAFMLHRLILNGDEVPSRLRAYAARQWERPSVREFVQHPRPAQVPDGYWAYAGTPKPQPA